jgi:hypothetical protein
MSTLRNSSSRFWALGQSIKEEDAFVLGESHLSRHLGVFGGSGSGKSKLLELLGRRLLDDYRGFCFIDPHGDTVEDLLAYAAKRAEDTNSDAICNRIHYLEPTFERVFGLDPFQFNPGTTIPDELKKKAYHAWLHTKADKIAEVVQRKQGQSDFQGMARLQRILRDVLIAVGTAIDVDGTHLPMSDILVLLDTQHARHRDVLQLVLPHLPSDVRGDFASLASMRSEENRKKETESTINRLRSLLSPIVKAIFSSAAQTIDFRKIIMNRGIILVNLRKTDFFSEDQRNAIGGLIIHEILSTVETTAREDRTPYYLIIDEARLFIGQDMMEALDQARKFKLSICLAGQYLGQFKTEEFDMTPSILNNCGNMICFQQKHPDDLKIWKEYFGYANLSFEKHFQVTDRPDGYDFIQIDDSSESKGKSHSKSKGGSQTESKGVGRTSSTGVARQSGKTLSRNRQTGVSCTDSEAISAGVGGGDSVTDSPIIVDGEIIAHTQIKNSNRSANSSSQRSNGRSSSEVTGEGEARSESVTRTGSTADSTSRSKGKGQNWSEGEGESESETISHKTVPLGRTREFVYESPQLQDSVDDQFHKFAHVQRTLAQRHANVSIVGKKESFVIKVADVSDVFSKKEFKAKIETMKKKIYGTHPYYSVPALAPSDQDKQLNEFLVLALGGETTVPDDAAKELENPEKSPFDN